MYGKPVFGFLKTSYAMVGRDLSLHKLLLNCVE